MEDNNESSINGQGTFSKTNGESGYDDDFVDIFGDTRGEGDYAIEESYIQQRMIQFLRDRIEKGKMGQYVEICSLLEARLSVLVKKLQLLIYKIN